jgi:hypothetical protein
MRLTTRGKIVLGIFLALGLLGLWEIVSHLFWNGAGYCWGNFTTCEIHP